MEELQKLMDEIAAWSNKTFGDGQRALPIAQHLIKENGELIGALLAQKIYPDVNDAMGKIVRAMVGEELADCFMLLLDCATHAGFDADELIEATKLKLEINKARKWGVPDENGVVEHIKE